MTTTLRVEQLLTLDGFGEGENQPGFYGYGGPELLQFFEEDGAVDHVLVMGANTYRMFAGMEGGMTEQMLAQSKIVFSSSLEEPLAWPNTRLIADDAVAAMRELKQTETLPMRTSGSMRLCRSFLAAGLVDRLRLFVFPLVLGTSGKDPAFPGVPDLRLELAEARTFDRHVQMLEYDVVEVDAQPRDLFGTGS